MDRRPFRGPAARFARGRGCMYRLTQEERMILSMVDDLCVDVVAERAAAIDEEDEFPQDIYELFVEQGLFALAYGEEHGGVEVSMHCWVQVIERIARESPAVALMILISAIGSDALVFSGSAEQQRAILPALAAGEAKICFALARPNAGSDISAISTTALPDGDGYTINGGKIFITNGAVGDWFTVFARVVEDGQSKPSCFIVHRDTPGLVIGRKEDKMGLRGSVTSQLYFENMHVGPEAVVGEVGDGFAIAHHTLNRGRLAVAAPGHRRDGRLARGRGHAPMRRRRISSESISRTCRPSASCWPIWRSRWKRPACCWTRRHRRSAATSRR